MPQRGAVRPCNGLQCLLLFYPNALANLSFCLSSTSFTRYSTSTDMSQKLLENQHLPSLRSLGNTKS